MKIRRLFQVIAVTASLLLASSAFADTYVIPFSEIRASAGQTGESPDDVIRDYLVNLLRTELENQGFGTEGLIILGDVPVDEYTAIIATDCNLPRPYAVHTDATSATITVGDQSSLVLDLQSIRSIKLDLRLVGTISAETTAWVRWGQDVPFGQDCATISTDHGMVGFSLDFDIGINLDLALDPVYDEAVLGLVIDKHADVGGQASFGTGYIWHDFGTLSPTDLVLDAFEDELLQSARSNGTAAFNEAVAAFNYRLDGLDENGDPDPTIEAFNAPSTVVIDVNEEDAAFVRDALRQFGIPDIVISMLDERGVDILLRLAVLEGAEREAYLAELGAAVSCDVLLGAFRTPLESLPIYTMDGGNCVVADPWGADSGHYFSDPSCASEFAYEPPDEAEFCNARFGTRAQSLLGNAAAWTPAAEQPNDVLPDVPSRPWSMTPGTQLDLTVLPLAGNSQPFLKRFAYRSIVDTGRGTGVCELEMRVYKKEIAGRKLKPLLALHGGTWRSRGYSFIGLESSISQLTERGFIVFAPFYRLVGESDGNVECNAVSWREVTADAESALDWVTRNGGALGAADIPVSVYGQSAGAHLAGWLAAHRPADVQKALMYYAPSDALAFFGGALPAGGRFDAFRDFGLRALSRFFGAEGGELEVRLQNMRFDGLTVDALEADWRELIPATVFELGQIDPASPPRYLARCAELTGTDLASISLGSPPAELIDCLKEDLKDFLVANSFYHLLADEAVPIHAVHGSADNLVPYQQSLELCGAIDGRVLPDDLVEPLTVYDCGTASKTQIIEGAEHALGLGVCLDALCPSGVPDSTTRTAVIAATNTAYTWLAADPPAAPEPPLPPPAPAPTTSGGGGGAVSWWFMLFGLLVLHRRMPRKNEDLVSE
jgi:acetyl esterase/lipase